MASSLNPECTPLKLEYDACFNSWFEGYLEPALGSGSGKAPTTSSDAGQRTRDKAAEYERKCGKVWESYRTCVQKAVMDKGLDALLGGAREENPLKESPAPSGDEAKPNP